jgi:aspartyl-tRNA(Asn)/glutamyl-tRNA(Gln) amidotransferase subunit C
MAQDAQAPDALPLVRHVARLARLALSEEELAQHARELGRLLEAFEVLGRFPGIAPREAEAAERGRQRPDEPGSSLPAAEVLRGAPEVEQGFFAVPRTVGGER